MSSISSISLLGYYANFAAHASAGNRRAALVARNCDDLNATNIGADETQVETGTDADETTDVDAEINAGNGNHDDSRRRRKRYAPHVRRPAPKSRFIDILA